METLICDESVQKRGHPIPRKIGMPDSKLNIFAQIRFSYHKNRKSIGSNLLDALKPVKLPSISENQIISRSTSGNNFVLDNDTFEQIADQLADEFALAVKNIPVLSDYAISRAGIYEEHP